MEENQVGLLATSPQTSKFSKETLTTLVVVAVSTALMSTGAHAETIGLDAFADIMALITSAVAIVSGIGMGVLSIYATAKVFKWVKAAF